MRREKIASNRKTIGDITELSIQAFDQREECQSKIQALQVLFLSSLQASTEQVLF